MQCVLRPIAIVDVNLSFKMSLNLEIFVFKICLECEACFAEKSMRKFILDAL